MVMLVLELFIFTFYTVYFIYCARSSTVDRGIICSADSRTDLIRVNNATCNLYILQSFFKKPYQKAG